MHPANYFEVGKTYKRTRYDEKTGREHISYVCVKNEDYAEHYHEMQSHNESFELD